MLNRQQLKIAVDRVLKRELERVFRTVPYAMHLIDEKQELDQEYYLRHRVETIKRIRLTSKTDALALARIVEEDYEAARWWSYYIAQELSHDLLYMKDLKQHGYTEEMVAAIDPFQSTIAMVNYIKTKIESIGALAAVAYSVCAEWNSERASARVVNKAERKYSRAHVSGAKAHVGIDENEDHYKVMLSIVHSLLVRCGDEGVLFDLLKDLMHFFGLYFAELYENTIASRELKSASL